MIFSKSVNSTQWRKDSLSTVLLGKLDIHTQKRMMIDPYLMSSTKINSKWIIDLNVRPTRRKHGGRLPDTGIGNDFLDMT